MDEKVKGLSADDAWEWSKIGMNKFCRIYNKINDWVKIVNKI